ncbi:MAG: PHP domain-containing protein [Myxococcales bacterium]|nr:PHP domain-containing protein [Myxococcales bacterium]
MRLLVCTLAALLAGAGVARADQTIHLEGDLPQGGADFVLVPFEVPAGVAEIEVQHKNPDSDNVIDFGLEDPAGFRGWGGGNSEPALVNEKAASRSYLPGPISAGTWNVVVGLALIKRAPGRYSIDVVLRDAATLAPQTERSPYAPSAPLENGARWYAGDFHVHSRESGDARPTIDEAATFASSRGLDFIVLTEHNTVSHREYLRAEQAKHPSLLLMPGIELTTYKGHMGLINATRYVDHKLGVGGRDIAAVVGDAVAQQALVSINHPLLDLQDACIGCKWEHAIPAELHAVEIATGGWKETGFLFGLKTIDFWDQLAADGRIVAAIGGSDDHRAGQDLGAFQSPTGSPTTMVYAEALSAEAIVAGVRAGRTVVKLQGPDDPMLDVAVVNGPEHAVGLQVLAGVQAELLVTVDGAKGNALRMVIDGERGKAVPIDADPFSYRLTVDTPETGLRRVRAEVWVGSAPRTVSSHVLLRREQVEDDGGGCAHALAVPPRDASVPLALLCALALLGAALVGRRRRSR